MVSGFNIVINIMYMKCLLWAQGHKLYCDCTVADNQSPPVLWPWDSYSGHDRNASEGLDMLENLYLEYIEEIGMSQSA